MKGGLGLAKRQSATGQSAKSEAARSPRTTIRRDEKRRSNSRFFEIHPNKVISDEHHDIEAVCVVRALHASRVLCPTM